MNLLLRKKLFSSSSARERKPTWGRSGRDPIIIWNVCSTESRLSSSSIFCSLDRFSIAGGMLPKRSFHGKRGDGERGSETWWRKKLGKNATVVHEKKQNLSTPLEDLVFLVGILGYRYLPCMHMCTENTLFYNGSLSLGLQALSLRAQRSRL